MPDAAVKPRWLLEAHYYDGGLRTSHLSVGTRPEWCPPPEVLETDSLERETDIAICCSRILRGDRDLTWVGVYVSAPDRQHGNRGTHVGVGLWLLDGVVIYQRLLIDFLYKLAALLRGGSSVETLIGQVDTEAIGVSITQYLASTSDYEVYLQSVPAASGQPARVHLPRGVGERAWLEQGASLLHWFQLSQDASLSRLVVIVSDQAPRKQRTTQPLPPTDDLVPLALERVPVALRTMRESLQTAVGKVDEDKGRIDSLRQEVIALTKARDEALGARDEWRKNYEANAVISRLWKDNRSPSELGQVSPILHAVQAGFSKLTQDAERRSTQVERRFTKMNWLCWALVGLSLVSLALCAVQVGRGVSSPVPASPPGPRVENPYTHRQ